MSAGETKYIELSSGNRMPVIGLGTWEVHGEELEHSLNNALEVGYRHIDTAFMHCNEDIIGKVINDWMENRGVSREELFITTKLPPIGMHPGKVKHFCDLSLKNLGLTYIDLYLIQIPMGMKYKSDEDLFVYHVDGSLAFDCGTDIPKVWKEMETLVAEEKVKAIGVSNFNLKQMEALFGSVEIKPANLQVEVHAYFQQKELRAFCRENNISVTAYCPLGSPGRDNIFASLGSRDAMRILNDPVVAELAERCNKTPAQVLLRHAIQKKICVIPKSVTPQRIKENFDVFNFFLIPNEMRTLDALDKKQRGRSFDYAFMGHSFISHPEFPFEIEPVDEPVSHH